MNGLGVLSYLQGGNKSYGFIKEEQLPKGDFVEKNLSFDEISWAKTGDYQKIARNHCGTVLISNIVIFSHFRASGKVLSQADRDEVFSRAHKLVGNGPVAFTKRAIKEILSIRNYKTGSSHLWTFEDIKSSLDCGKPVSLLLTKAPLDWHWVLGLGYREYQNGEKFMRLVTGWQDSDSYFYRIREGAGIFTARSYRIFS